MSLRPTLTYIVFTAYTDIYYLYGLHWPILSLRPTLTYIVFTAYTDLYCLYGLHWPILSLRPTLTYIVFTAYTDLYCLYGLHWPILSLRPTLTYSSMTSLSSAVAALGGARCPYSKSVPNAVPTYATRMRITTSTFSCASGASIATARRRSHFMCSN